MTKALTEIKLRDCECYLARIKNRERKKNSFNNSHFRKSSDSIHWIVLFYLIDFGIIELHLYRVLL